MAACSGILAKVEGVALPVVATVEGGEGDEGRGIIGIDEKSNIEEKRSVVEVGIEFKPVSLETLGLESRQGEHVGTVFVGVVATIGVESQ